ncbi:universal stress protein [Anianabacter salinae]|uniref:universal stress protein n=1 Tax=Anianabacter salinae TaxID=2851023 RepID=UPI00225E1584|nr:universal stress protein [Anianabacter salinae]MBV0910855.1 universal stress protein [Anianabacter salinae]
MAYKTIATVLTDAETGAAGLDAAAAIARREDGHLHAVCIGVDRTEAGFYYAGASAVVLDTNLTQAREDAAALAALVDHRMKGTGTLYTCETATAQFAAVSSIVAHHTRMADLVVLPKPYGDGRGPEHEAVVEAALFGGQVPVLFMPLNAPLPEDAHRVVIAWNESAEALSAIRAALPILKAADSVNIAIIDPPKHGPDRSDPGGALGEMLSRHGVRAEVSVLARTMPRISDVLCRHVEDIGADLVVMGAYGHSRFREAILGGATRNMLQTATVPVLMAH